MRTRDHDNHRHRTVDLEATATAAEVVTLQGKAGGGPMVKERIATYTDGTVEAPMGMATAVATMATTTRDAEDDVPHHHVYR